MVSVLSFVRGAHLNFEVRTYFFNEISVSLLEFQRQPNPSASYTDAQDCRALIYLFILVADAHYCATMFYSTVSVILRGLCHSPFISLSVYYPVVLFTVHFTYRYLATVLCVDSPQSFVVQTTEVRSFTYCLYYLYTYALCSANIC